VKLFGDLIAVAGCRLKLFAVENSDVATAIFDQPTLLQGPGDRSDRSPLRTEHHGQKLLGEVENARFGASMRAESSRVC
jgi:hypothetical protein